MLRAWAVARLRVLRASARTDEGVCIGHGPVHCPARRWGYQACAREVPGVRAMLLEVACGMHDREEVASRESCAAPQGAWAVGVRAVHAHAAASQGLRAQATREARAHLRTPHSPV